MWARIVGSQLVEIINSPKAMRINDIQYPKSIFTRAWTDEERKAIGIVPYVYSGINRNDEYYTSTSSDSVGDDVIFVYVTILYSVYFIYISRRYSIYFSYICRCYSIYCVSIPRSSVCHSNFYIINK